MKKLAIWSCIVLMLLAGTLPVYTSAAEPEQVEIPVQIQVNGAEPDREARYTVELTARTPGAPMPEGSSEGRWQMTLKVGESGKISIPCGRLGAFDYSICQVPGKVSDCTYDEAQYRLRLLVTQAEDGSKAVTALLFGQQEEKLPSVLFQNRWAEPAYLSFSAWKTMDGETPKDGAFTFRLLAEDGEIVYETKNDGRRVRFPELRFDREGTFRFFLKEVAGKNQKILYDRSVYTVTVTVTKDVDYQATVSYERNGKPWSGLPAFANYTDTGSPKTGDSIGVWFGLLGISATALCVLLILHRKRQ